MIKHNLKIYLGNLKYWLLNSTEKHNALKIIIPLCIINANFSHMCVLFNSLFHFLSNPLFFFSLFSPPPPPINKRICNVGRNFRKGQVLQKGKFEGGRWCAYTCAGSFSCRILFLRAWTHSGRAKWCHKKCKVKGHHISYSSLNLYVKNSTQVKRALVLFLPSLAGVKLKR